MALVRFCKSILEDEYEELHVEAGITIEEVIRKYGDDDVYKTSLVECYDCDTGETYFAPIEDAESFGAIITVNGEDKGLDYVIAENDICGIVITPRSSGQANDNWNWWGALVGSLVGSFEGMISGLTLSGNWIGGAVGAILGGILGFVAGGIIVGQMLRDKNSDSRSGSALPDIAGSQNQIMDNTPIPMVIGKMEIAPFIAGSPYVEYKGLRGNETYINVLYCVGYSPLRITNFKFDGLIVSENKNQNDLSIYQGKLSGNDIKEKWFSNDVEFEIIQQNENSDVVVYGDNYNHSVLQIEAKSTPMYIKDSHFSDLVMETMTAEDKGQKTYKFRSYEDGFRSNSVRFSEQYPKKIKVVLDVPTGIYASRSEDGVTKYKSMPLWMAIQWRPYNQDNENNKEHNSDANFSYEYDEVKRPNGWITFDYINPYGDGEYGCLPTIYGSEQQREDMISHEGNSSLYEKVDQEKQPEEQTEEVMWKLAQEDNVSSHPSYPSFPEPYGLLIDSPQQVEFNKWVYHLSWSDDGYKEQYQIIPLKSGNYRKLYLSSFTNNWYRGHLFRPAGWPEDPWRPDGHYDEDENGQYILVDSWVWSVTHQEKEFVCFANNEWIGAKAFNLQALQDKITDTNKKNEINMSEFRATAEIDLKKWCEDHGKAPEEFLFNKNNTTSAVEVRVIRITPNYMDETKSTKDHGPWTYQDQVTWNYIVTETFDPEIDYDEIRRRAENEMHSLEAAGVKHVFGRRTYTGEDMRENGWSEFTDDDTIVTVYSHTVSSNGRHYLLTPCAWNESKGQHLLSKSDFESAVAQFLFIRQDLEGIVLYSSTNIEECNDVAKRLHNAHEIWYCVEEPTTKAEEKALPLSLMMDSRPVSDSKYKKACFLTLRCKLDTVGNIEGQLSRLSVVAQAFSPYWDGAKWFPMNLKSGYKYYSEPNDKKKRTLLVDGEKTAKEQYEYKRMVGLDAIRTKGGNNWKSLVDAEIFDHVISEHSSDVNPTYSSNSKNVYITSDALKFLEDETGLLNTPANAFALTVIGQQCGIDAKDFGEINELSLGEWYEQLQAVKDGRVNDDGTDFELRFGCNAYLYSGVKVEDVLSKIASSGRAAYTRDDNGKLVVVMDNPVEYPRGVLNSENALGTTITYNFNLSPSGLMINFKNEANNYQDFGLPVMDDGEDYRNPTKAIEQGAVDFVTNIDQIYSLGRFVMANSIFGKKAISWKTGIEGYDINFGEVYAVSTDILLIGLANARIADLILSKDGTKCYGVILTDTYEFDGKTKDGRSIYGIEIHQPGQYEESKVVTIRFNNGEGITDGENRVNCQQIGVTNKVVFEAPISLVGRTLDNGVSYNFNPQQGNNVSIGEIGKISELYRVKSKTPEDKGTFTLQLVKYDPEFYNYGKALPKIKSNTSMIQTDTDSVVTVSGLVPAEYVNESNNTQRKELNDALSDITVDTPYILSVNGSNVIKNGDGSVTLTPTIFKGATQIDTVPSEMKIQWYVDNVASLGYGPGRFVDESILELTGEDVSDKVLVTCKLEDIQRYVAGFEDESGEILYSGFLDEDTSKADREYLEGFQDATRSL